MKRLESFLLLAPLCLISTLVLATDSTDLQLDTRLSYGYASFSEETMQTVVEAAPIARIRIAPAWKAEISGRIRLDFTDELEPGRASTDTYSDLSRPLVMGDTGTLELRNVFLERRLKHGVLRIGKQQIAWGKVDGIKVLDVLNPQNLREFILEDFGESRISLWSVYLDVSKSGWRGELAVVPDNTGHAVPTAGSWFELTAPRYRYGANSGDPTPTTVTHRESVSVDTSAMALRMSRQFGTFELGTVAYSGIDHEPLGRVTNVDGNPAIERFYERRDLYGASVETAFGAFVLRAEFASQPNRMFNTRNLSALETVQLDQTTTGIGLDIDGPLSSFINLQYVRDEVRDAPSTLVRPAVDRITTVFLTKSFSYETFRVSARWYRSQELGDEMISFTLQFNPSDDMRLRLALDAFSGVSTGIFGQFADRDRITISVEHTF